MSPSIASSSVDPSDKSPPRSANGRPDEKKGPRNLIVCIDGTSNKFGRHDTNVVKLAAKVDLKSPHAEQYVYYSSGIGTRPSTANIFSRIKWAVLDKLDMAVAWNVREIVEDAYYWLAQIYKEGDQIYLFGFSRGAYQVRVLAGMIDEVGLLKTATDKQIGMAYDRYEAIRSKKPHAKQSATRFKNTFCHANVKAHFLGVWDTVSSVGLIKEAVLPFGEHATHVRHALALDERRVKFMPEYFKKMNVEPGDEKSKRAQHASTTSGMEVCTSDKKKSSSDVKEVWFAGNHADVGGVRRPGTPFQAGNPSLLWMRREAAEHGLVLKPTDVVWVPDDIDFGINDSMNPIWKMVEYLPITHQVTFSGDGEDARRLHRQEPRCIIPGQKVHASILYAKTYKPRASLGRGFHIPVARDAEDTKLDWEEALFDKTAADGLVGRLENKNGVAPVYLDKLLFMLQFEEGKQCVRNVPGWQGRFMALLESDCELLVKLVAIITLYEASSNVDTHTESVPQPNFLQVFDNAKNKFHDLLGAYKHDVPTVFTLLQPLTKHRDLWNNILTKDVLELLIKRFDEVVRLGGRNFGQAMVSLDCLLQCEEIRETVIKKLEEHYPGSSKSRLERILRVKDKQLLIPALRMVMTLAQIAECGGPSRYCYDHSTVIRDGTEKVGSAQGDPGSTSQDASPPPKEASSTTKALCAKIKPRLRQLATNHEGLVGLLAMEILLVLYHPKTDRDHVDIRGLHVRANLFSVLIRSGPAKGEQPDPAKHKLSSLFKHDSQDPEEKESQQTFCTELCTELFKAVRRGKPEERTAATKALVELWKSEPSFNQLMSEPLCARLLHTFVDQLRHKEKALLAAYALAECLKYDRVKVEEALKGNNAFARNIAEMLRLDYFDDAVGTVEGFEIFKDLMRNEDLRKNMKKEVLFKLLREKLVKGSARETRTSLICLSVLPLHDKDVKDVYAQLVKDGLECLGKSKWNDRKAGVAILSALAETKHGVDTISSEIGKIIDMLLPSTPSGFRGLLYRGRVSLGFTDPAQEHRIAKSPYLMLGPVHALCNLAQYKDLWDRMRDEEQYVTLKQLYLSGTLINKERWYLSAFTPRRTDVVETLDNLMRALDEEPEAKLQSSDIQGTPPLEIQSNVASNSATIEAVPRH